MRRETRKAVGDIERRGIQSVEIGVRVLNALAAQRKPQSLKALAGAAELPASQTHRYLASYLRTGMVRQDALTGHYDLGATALSIGLAALARLDAYAIGQAALQTLGDTVDRTCFLAVWSERGPLIVNWYRGSRPLMTSLDIGSSLPVIGSATGHVFLSFNPPAMTSRLVAAEIAAAPRRSGAKRTDMASLRARVRRAGFERIHETLIPGLHALSAPILNHQGEAAIVLTVLMRARDADQAEPKILAALRATASRASAQLGSA
jgi:DNA-binding IclR family transcriptional regulator